MLNFGFIPLFIEVYLLKKKVRVALGPCLGGGNGREKNEKNNFRIFFPSIFGEI